MHGLKLMKDGALFMIPVYECFLYLTDCFNNIFVDCLFPGAFSLDADTI